jgi:hypothetical protein
MKKGQKLLSRVLPTVTGSFPGGHTPTTSPMQRGTQEQKRTSFWPVVMDDDDGDDDDDVVVVVVVDVDPS